MKVIIAMDNKEIIEIIKKNKQIKNIVKNIQYREAILEILEKEKRVDYIFIYENIPGEISIEELIKKINKKTKNKINIIFFLEKEDKNKEEKLKKLGIKKIFYNNKNNIDIILKILEKKDNNKYENNKKQKNNKALIISVFGKKRVGKTTIVFLLINFLLKQNKKILIININKKIEKEYLILLGKKYFKYKNNKINNIKNKTNKKDNKKIEIKINKNLTFLKEKNNYKNNYKKINFLNKYNHKYDYIIIDIGTQANNEIKELIFKNSDKKIIVMDANMQGIKEINQFNKERCLQKKEAKNGLHIIQNQYKFDSISFFIVQKILKNFPEVSKIYFKQKYKNLEKNLLNNKKIKINIVEKNKIKKLIEK